MTCFLVQATIYSTLLILLACMQLCDVVEHYKQHPHTPFGAMPPQELLACYGPLLPLYLDPSLYHVFLSYRWSEFDSKLIARLADAFSLETLGAAGDRLHVFYDRQSLEAGREFDVGYMSAMLKARIICPLVTTNALAELGAFPERVDNVLCEWRLALFLYDREDVITKRIVPVFAGKVRGSAACIANNPLHCQPELDYTLSWVLLYYDFLILL